MSPRTWRVSVHPFATDDGTHVPARRGMVVPGASAGAARIRAVRTVLDDRDLVDYPAARRLEFAVARGRAD